MSEYSLYLEEYVYDKLWRELSAHDKKVLIAMAELHDQKVEAIRAKAGKNSSSFGVYRNRLMKQGIVIATDYGYLDFALHRFRVFAYRMR